MVFDSGEIDFWKSRHVLLCSECFIIVRFVLKEFSCIRSHHDSIMPIELTLGRHKAVF